MKEKGTANSVAVLTLFALLLSHSALAPGYASSLRPTWFPASSPPVSKQPSLCPPREADRARALSALEKTPLSFIKNGGQLDSRVAYYVQGRDTTIYFTPHGLTFALLDQEATQHVADNLEGHSASPQGSRITEAMRVKASRRWAVHLYFIGANCNVQPRGENPTATTYSYFKGAKDQWKTGLAGYSTIVYSNLWPGIDLVYTGASNRLKYEFIVRPGANPNQIRLAYSGATDVKLNQSGQLEVITPAGNFHDECPVSYQETNSKRTPVTTSFKLAGDKTKSRVGYCFRVGNYDKSKPLVIDPAVIIYAGFIGGSNTETALRVAVDNAGNAYVAGITGSNTTEGFPATVGPDVTFNPNRAVGPASFDILDVFIAKVKVDGTGLVYAGYIGGTGNQVATGIAVDSAGNAYVVGATDSKPNTFPVTVGPKLTYSAQKFPKFPALTDALLADGFIAKVNASGTGLVYSGYVGGDGPDFVYSVAVDGAGSAYLTGETGSSPASLPVTIGPSLNFGGGIFDAFVAKVKVDGSGFDYLGYIGGADVDRGFAIAVDSSGSAYVTGETGSPASSLPVTVGPSLTFGSLRDAFVAKVKPDGTGLVYLGYVGGAGVDVGSGIAVDSSGNAYVTGGTSSPESSFPVTVGPKVTYNGSDNPLFGDAFVAKIKSDGTGFVYAGYVGGSGGDTGFDVKLDAAGNAYVVGATTSANFPVTDGSTFKGGTTYGDAFVAVVKTDGTGLIAAGFFGGANDEAGTGIALDGAGNVYITGSTGSTEASFPVTVGPFTANSGFQDAFVAKLRFSVNANAPTISSISPASGSINGGTNVTITGTKFVKRATVSVGGIEATDVVFISNTQITATTPPHAAGTVSVVVTNPDGDAGVLPNGFTYITPLAPSVNGVTKQGKKLFVTGQNFDDGAKVYINGEKQKSANDETSPSTSLIAKKAGKLIQPGDKVTVHNSDGTVSNEFTYNP
ncbi:MAG TPA: SBBP repeat-containing protein [Blastocatellia bacterium]|nr:SBBP repeat-containing protein [Blastocatellia bacterium]